jgi:hypothetical protein
MRDKESSSSFISIIVALIGAIGLILAALIGAFFGRSEGVATGFEQALATITQEGIVADAARVVEITKVVEVTQVVEQIINEVDVTRVVEVTKLVEVPQTIIPIPTGEVMSTNSDTPTTVLEIDDIWKQGDYEVTFTDVELAYNGGGYTGSFYLTSHKNQTVTIVYSLADLDVYDNVGRKLRTDIPYNYRSATCIPQRIVITPGEQIPMYCLGSDTPGFSLYVDTADPAITEVLIFFNTLDITNLAWRIPVPH